MEKLSMKISPEDLLAYARAQRELRELFLKKLEAFPDGNNRFYEQFIKLGANSDVLRDYAKNPKGIGPGVALNAFCLVFERPDLRELIETGFPKLRDRVSSASLFSDDVLLLCLALNKTRERAEGFNLSFEDFLHVFAPYQAEAGSLILFNRNGMLKAVENFSAIGCLKDLSVELGWEDRVDSRLEEVLTAYDEKKAGLKILVDQLKEIFGSQENVSRELKVDSSEISSLCSGKARSSRRLEKLVKIAKKKLADFTLSEKLAKEGSRFIAPVISQGQKSSLVEKSEVPKSQEALPEKGMKELSSEGDESEAIIFSHALTPENFHPNKAKITPEMVKAARDVLTLARANLNFFTQIEDQKDRERVRKQLGPDVEELYLAIKLFSENFPNLLLPILHAQRITFNKRRSEK